MFWRQLKLVPKQELNRQLLAGVLVFGIMGAARGLDEGTISGTLTQPSFIKQFGLNDSNQTAEQLANLKSNIASMVQVGCIAGTILGFSILDLVGRIHSLQILCIIWIVGSIIQISSFGGVGQLYAGRFIAGIGIGMTSVCCPAYIVEVAPAPIRGLCTCLYSGSVYLGIMIGYFANWGTTVHISSNDRKQWVIPNSLQIIVAGIGVICSFFVPESPRWLFKVRKTGLAIDTLCRLRHLSLHDQALDDEITHIHEQLGNEPVPRCESLSGSSSIYSQEVVTIETGTDETTKKAEYKLAKRTSTPMSRIPSKTWRRQISHKLKHLKSCKYQLFLCLMIQLLAQWTGSNAVTIYAPEFFKMVGITEQNTRLLATSMFGVVKLLASLVCALVIIDYFGRKRALYSGITLQIISMLYLGIFLAVQRIHHLSPHLASVSRAGSGAVAMIYINGVGWALGWNSIQYLINAEVFPLQARSTAASLVMCFHFANQYANSKALPTMLLHMDDWGALIFFSCVAMVGLFFAWFFIPEAAGLELEDVERLFGQKWYRVGRTKIHHIQTSCILDKETEML